MGGGGAYPLSSQAPTHVEVELGCDNILLTETSLSTNTWKTEGLRVKDEGLRTKGEVRSVKDKG